MLNVSRRQNRRVSTKLESLAQAEDFAEDWYLELRGKHRAGELKSEKTFRDAAAQHVMDVMRLQHLDVRGIGTETVFGHNHLEIGVILTERADQPFGGLALTVMLRGPILFDNEFRHQGNDLTLVRMDQGSPTI